MRACLAGWLGLTYIRNGEEEVWVDGHLTRFPRSHELKLGQFGAVFTDELGQVNSKLYRFALRGSPALPRSCELGRVEVGSVLALRSGRSDRVLKLHVEEQERGVNGRLLEIIVKDALVEASEDVALTRQEDHLEVLQVPQEEHSSVHHVQQALVHKFVLVGHHLNDVLLDCQRDWHFEHIIATL